MPAFSRRLRHTTTIMAAMILTFPFATHADTVSTWNGTIGNWSDASKWSTNPFYPNNGNPVSTLYDAVVNAGTLTLNVNPEVQRLSLTGGTLTGSGNLLVDELLTWSGGGLAGSGTITAGALVLGAGVSMSGTRVLINTGTATSAGTLSLLAGNIFVNQGTLTINSTKTAGPGAAEL